MTDVFVLQSSNHRLLVNDLPAGSIDNDTPWFQQPDPMLANQTNRF
jgi:hypothetical protein